MSTLEIHSHNLKRARTRSLIQLGGLVEKAGLLEIFHIKLGLDLQKNPEMKEPIGALFKGLVELNEMVKSDQIHLKLWAAQGLQKLKDWRK